MKIFLSKPNTLCSAQQKVDKFLMELLFKRGFEPLTLKHHDDPLVSPVEKIGWLMRSCQGAIVMGFSQVRISEGTFGHNTFAESRLQDVVFASPWNQVESGMALMLNLPLLLICEEEVYGGVFDPDSSNTTIHRINLETAKYEMVLRELLDQWCSLVAKRRKAA